MNSLGYSSLDELYGNNDKDKSTDLSLLNVEQESICTLANSKAKPKRSYTYKNLGKYAQYDGSSNENNKKIITTNDVPKTSLYNRSKDCKEHMQVDNEFAIKPYNIMGAGEVNLASFDNEMDLPTDYELKKYILDENELKKGGNKNSFNKNSNSFNDHIFMDISSNLVDFNNPNDVMNDTIEPEKPLLKKNLEQNKVKKNNNNSNNSNNDKKIRTLNDDSHELNENVIDKYLVMVLYIFSGLVLILIMEQILQLGMKMKL